MAVMLTQESLRRLLHYDPETGDFTWLRRQNNTIGDRRFNAVWPGRLAGRLCRRTGYVAISIANVRHQAHRLAYLYITGVWPPAVIDHQNGIGSDNRWTNLRSCNQSQNAANARRRVDNTSGAKGVWRHKGLWRARLKADGQIRYLGLFRTRDEAAAAYAEAAKLHCGEFVRLS